MEVGQGWSTATHWLVLLLLCLQPHAPSNSLVPCTTPTFSRCSTPWHWCLPGTGEGGKLACCSHHPVPHAAAVHPVMCNLYSPLSLPAVLWAQQKQRRGTATVPCPLLPTPLPTASPSLPAYVRAWKQQCQSRRGQANAAPAAPCAATSKEQGGKLAPSSPLSPLSSTPCHCCLQGAGLGAGARPAALVSLTAPLLCLLHLHCLGGAPLLLHCCLLCGTLLEHFGCFRQPIGV